MKKILTAIVLAAFGLAVLSSGAQSRSNKSALSRNLTIFNSIVKELESNYVDSIEIDKVVRTAIDVMLDGIDPYTVYYSDDEREELTSISSGKYGGVGAYILKRGDNVIVHELVWDAPAIRSGLREGDIFLRVDGTDVTAETNTEDVSKRLRGQPGSTVRVDIKRPYAEDSLLSFDIPRSNIIVNPMPYSGVDSTGIGYIRLTTFNENSADAIRDAVSGFKQNPDFKGVVLDLRGNGGGLLESAVHIVGLFVPKGTEVVRTKGFGDSNMKIYKTTRQPIDTEIPVAILTDGGTASSSEIVAGALQDLDRAVIIGERSYGKGLVQTTRPLPYDGLLKVTVSRYYIPSGRLIQAIDYSHRNPDGSVARIPDSLTTVWHTAHGREVRDGGGITPDIVVADTTMNRLIYNVISDFWAFDYANRFAVRTPSLPSSDEWVVGDSIFNDFKSFIDPAKFKYDRMCQIGLDYLRDAAKAEGYMTDSVAAQLAVLDTLLRHDLDHDLNFNRDELIEILDTEISERYYSDADRVKRHLRYDNCLDTARAVLLDKERYSAILNPSKKK